MNKKLLWATAAVLFWMIVIFALSHQPASESNGLSRWVSQFLAENYKIISGKEDYNLSNFNRTIRKCAHFTLYFVLGIFTISMLKKLKVNGIIAVLLSLIFCILFAITDEWHQLFVDGRGAQVSDVIIDSAGATLGIILYVVISWGVKMMKS